MAAVILISFVPRHKDAEGHGEVASGLRPWKTTRVSIRLDAVLKKLPGVILLVVLFNAYSIYKYLSSPDQAILECAFAFRPSSTPLRVPSTGRPIENFRVAGRLYGDGPERTLLSFQGSPVRSPNGSQVGEVSGVVFIADDGAVNGLSLSLRRADYGRDEYGRRELRIVTLNRDGQLDNDRSRAFHYFHSEEKLSHPAGYACTIERRRAPFSWLPD